MSEKIKVNTYWLGKNFAQDKESDNAICGFCDRRATYWTQAEDDDWRPWSEVFYHCQAHRNQARAAVTLETKHAISG